MIVGIADFLQKVSHTVAFSEKGISRNYFNKSWIRASIWIKADDAYFVGEIYTL